MGGHHRAIPVVLYPSVKELVLVVRFWTAAEDLGGLDNGWSGHASLHRRRHGDIATCTGGEFFQRLTQL